MSMRRWWLTTERTAEMRPPNSGVRRVGDIHGSKESRGFILPDV